MMMSAHHRLSGSLILDEKSMAWLVNRNFTGLLKSRFQEIVQPNCRGVAPFLQRLWLLLLLFILLTCTSSNKEEINEING